MDQEQAKAHMNRLLDEAGRRAADRNVEQLQFAGRALGQRELQSGQGMPAGYNLDRGAERQSPGSRPDGGMAPHDMNPVQLVSNALTDARRIVDNFEKNTIELESKIAELEARLAGERDRCTRLEKMLQEIVDLVSPR